MRFHRLKRREFIALVCGAAAAWPLVARAQGRVPRIGVLMALAENDPELKPWLAGFRERIEALGWTDGRNVHIDYRFAPAASAEKAQAFAKELVALQPDVIFAQSTPVVAALRAETRSIPIVFVLVSDPIGSGFIASFARPGGNLTGMGYMEAGMAGKWIAMLKEIAPRATRAAFLFNPKTTSYGNYLDAARNMGNTVGIELVASPVENAAGIQRAIDDFAQSPNGSLVVPPDTTTAINRDLVITRAARHQLPAVYSGRFWVMAGGLMSYGADRIDLYRQAAFYVDHILRGANPADLPVQTPTKFETIINAKTAKALGLTVGLLVAADEVIE
jgi:putative ABC transport system substrate-binding protein